MRLYYIQFNGTDKTVPTKAIMYETASHFVTEVMRLNVIRTYSDCKRFIEHAYTSNFLPCSKELYLEACDAINRPQQ